jgi:Flp pilus assembly protein TadG
MRVRGTRTRLGREDGAAAVEFALIAGLLAMLIFGMMEYGLAFWQLQNLRAASREGARVAAIGGRGSDVLTAVNEQGNVSLTGSSVRVCTYSSSSPSSCQLVSASSAQKYCGLATNPPQAVDTAVRVELPMATLPASIKSIFKIDIPLLPSITLTPDLSGTFRCEGTG